MPLPVVLQREGDHASVSMAGAGFSWLVAPLKVGEVLRDTQFSFDASWLRTPALYLSWSYLRLLHRGRLDWSFAG